MNAVAAILARIIRAFARADAFSEEHAKTLDDLFLPHRFQRFINRLVRRGALVQTADDRYYMRQEYYERRKSIQRIALMSLFIIVLIYLATILFTNLGLR